MVQLRTSTPRDVPAQRQLWALSFGDEGAYVDNFYQTYYRPERVLVLEAEGEVRSMATWFDTTFVVPERGSFRAAYLYAVATHPDCRGRGYSGRLLAWADQYLKKVQGFDAVTTMPAQPSLHRFFARNGFRECFVLGQEAWLPQPGRSGCPLTPLTAREYGALRERLLEGISHIAYPQDALEYQAGACAVSGGGLFRADTAAGPMCLCAEGAKDGLLVVKELLGPGEGREQAMAALHQKLGWPKYLVRGTEGEIPFSMLKWLDGGLEQGWDWSSTAYLGLAFD